MERKVICTFDDDGRVDVKFLGGHLLKRDLLRLLRAVKLQYRLDVRVYRRQMLAATSTQRVEAEKKEANKELVQVLGAKKDDNTVTK